MKECFIFLASLCIALGECQREGYRAFSSCEEALRRCPAMLFPSPGRVFTAEGLSFPVRIAGFTRGKEEIDFVLLPGKKTRIPSSDAVLEVPLCVEVGK